MSEPVAFEYQHEETGVIGYIDQWQIDNGFFDNNPRLQLIGPLYRHPPKADLEQQLMQDEEIAELKAQIVELRVVLAQSRKAADAAGTYTLWSCGEMSARRQVGRLKEAIKEFDALQGEGDE